MFCSSQSSQNHWPWPQLPLQWLKDKPECSKDKRAQGFMVALSNIKEPSPATIRATQRSG